VIGLSGSDDTAGEGQEKQLMTNEEPKQKALQTLSPQGLKVLWRHGTILLKFGTAYAGDK